MVGAVSDGAHPAVETEVGKGRQLSVDLRLAML